jgi:hypothetical protein
MEAPYPDTSNPNADQGTVAHDVSAKCLEFDKDSIDFLHSVMPEYEHITIDNEMIDYTQVYIDEIRRRAKGKELLVECRVDFSRWVPEGFGTSDVVLLGDGVIEIHDLKYGMKKVEAPGNEQLLLYALGAYHQFSALDDYHSVKMVIHQPRLGHISEAELLIEDLMDFAGRAKTCAEITMLPDAGLIAGEKQCCWCKAKNDCPAAKKHMDEIIGADFEDLTKSEVLITEGSFLISDERIPEIYSQLEYAENYMKSFCSEVRSRMFELVQGGKTETHKLVTGKKGNRAFRDEGEAIKLMKKMRLKIDEMYDKKLKSPSKIAKILKGRDKQWGRVASLIVQAEGKAVIAPIDDKRIAISDVAEDFEDLG